MTNYTNLSDFEINKRVAILANPEFENWACYDISGRACFVINDNSMSRAQHGYSFTSDWSDAGPIIQENYITLGYDGFSWESFSIKWEGLHYSDWKNYPEEPLRIAMILFLMGKGSEQ